MIDHISGEVMTDQLSCIQEMGNNLRVFELTYSLMKPHSLIYDVISCMRGGTIFKVGKQILEVKNGMSAPIKTGAKAPSATVRPQHSALPLILFAFIHDFASLTQFTHSFHFHAYLMSRSPIYYFN